MIHDFGNRWEVDLSVFGVYPREWFGLPGILLAPMVHGDIWHLLSNTFPILILGTVLYYFYSKIATKAIIMMYLLTNILLWIGIFPLPLNGFMVRDSFHIGASGVVYAMAAFLFFSGVFRRNRESLSISLAVAFLYGGLLYGLFPDDQQISYEAHFFGAVSGVAVAYYFKGIRIWDKAIRSDDDNDFRYSFAENRTIPRHFRQNANTLMMVRPLNFGYNKETAESNSFQHYNALVNPKDVREKARLEFDALAQKIRSAGVTVYIFDDQHTKVLPDAVFPNNWISFHHDGKVIQYPMLSELRRQERRDDIIDMIAHQFKHLLYEKIDFTPFEATGQFLEGTGSIIFDHPNKIAYANISARTNANLFINLCERIGYTPTMFHSSTADGQEIYHTNVMLAIGEEFAVICVEVIRDEKERDSIMQQLRATRRDVIEITEDQMDHFCGNILQVENHYNHKFIVMSTEAYTHFTPEQQGVLSQHGNIIHSDLSTIENFGGGSARCMLAEVFLRK